MKEAFLTSFLLCTLLGLSMIACIQSTSTMDIKVSEAKTIISENPNITIIDVRTPGEFSVGHLDEAININVRASDFQDQLVQQLDTAHTYLVYCRSGNRSKKAVKIMEDIGFTHLYHMLGGYLAWEKEHKKK